MTSAWRLSFSAYSMRPPAQHRTAHGSLPLCPAQHIVAHESLCLCTHAGQLCLTVPKQLLKSVSVLVTERKWTCMTDALGQSRSDLQVGSRLDAGELVGQGVHGRAVLQQLVQHKVQKGRVAVCALHICQLQQRIQLEPCST